MLSRFYLIIFLSYIIPTIVFSTPQLTLNENVSSYDNFKIEYLEEKPNESLGIDKISKMPFTKTISNAFTFGYKENNFWFRLSVYNDSEKPKNMILELTEIIHKTVDLYILSDPIIHKKNGLSVPVEKREIQESNPAFSLQFAPYETKELYINLASIYGVFGSIKLKTEKQFQEDTQFKKYMYVFYFSTIFIIALYNFVLFFYLREKIYLYYIGYVFVFIIWAANYKGVLLPYTDMQTYDFLQITIPIFFTLLILFSQSILLTKTHFPFLHKILNGFVLILTISLIWMLISMHSGFYFMNLSASPLLPFLLFVAFWALYKGHKIARIYLFGLSIYIISMIIISQLALGIIHYSVILSHAPIIGSFFEIILFSLLLAYRINLLRQEKLDSQVKLLEQDASESIRLAKMVEAKTSELNALNTKLEIELEEKTELEKILTLQASTDSLTGVLNRRCFFDACAKEMKMAKRYKRKLSFLIIDIDSFKNINDIYGHLGGDDVLVEIINRVKEIIRTTDIFGRIGGEEFALLMPETGLESALHLAERIRQHIANQDIEAEGQMLNVTVSIGLDIYREDDPNIQAILRRSDLALYKAKESGRNKVYYEEA